MLRVRNEAKTNVRRFVDDVAFVVGKESRDRLKGIQRQLRDHYREIANQTTRSLNESLQATLTAAQLEETERDRAGSRNSSGSSTSCGRSRRRRQRRGQPAGRRRLDCGRGFSEYRRPNGEP